MVIRLTEKEAQKLFNISPKRKNKYNAQKTVIDGKTFASKFEAEYYAKLLLLKKAGEITEIECQKPFTLQEGFIYEGKRFTAIKYYADFVVTYKNGKVEVIDTKGHKTSVYNIKKKLLLAKYPNINFLEVYRK